MVSLWSIVAGFAFVFGWDIAKAAARSYATRNGRTWSEIRPDGVRYRATVIHSGITRRASGMSYPAAVMWVEEQRVEIHQLLKAAKR